MNRSLVWFALANHQTHSVHPPLMRHVWTAGGGIGADGATDLRPCRVLQISRWCWQGPPCAPVLRAGDIAISQHDPHKRVVPPLTAQCDTALISAALAGEPRCCSVGERANAGSVMGLGSEATARVQSQRERWERTEWGDGFEA